MSGIIQKEKPKRIVEVGSGFSSAVALDTLEKTSASAELTFVEPFPKRLYSLLSKSDKETANVLVQKVQDVDMQVFTSLEAQDILFVDSSHVAKIGSDVSHLLLRVLPIFKPGVIIHFHDIFYPQSYPMVWLRDGLAWNESLMLRAFLIGNSSFEILAFNAFANAEFASDFYETLPRFAQHGGGSFWCVKSS
ncbi:class I SAM-dependent methyltransferase [Pseudomonadota bacterium]